MKIVILDGFTINPGDNPWDTLADAENWLFTTALRPS